MTAVRDFYEVLGVPRDASPKLVQLAFEGKMKALADPAYAASPAEKREEERLLKEAFVTLSNPAKRGPYDEKLAAFEEQASAAPSRPAWLVPAVAAALVVAIGGGILSRHLEDRERQRVEAERQARQEEEARLRAIAREEREREMTAQREAREAEMQARNEQYRTQRERADFERWRSSVDQQARYGESLRQQQDRNALYEAQRAESQRRQAEERERREEESRRRQALSEVERQKEFLRRQEMEEERLRAERHYRAQQEAREREYRQMLEERRRQQQSR